MPLDAVCLAGLTKELRGRIIGMRIDKVQQPERDMLLFSLRGNGDSVRLLLCTGTGNARVHLTEQSFEQPAQPPMFCMLLRKHLVGARITDVNQPDFDRVLIFEMDALDELGAPMKRTIVVEMMGRNSNLMLLDGEGRIIECMRRVDPAMSEKRPVLPGLIYRPAPQQDKPCFFRLNSEERRALWKKAPESMPADRWLLDSFSGLSPLICRELCYRAFGETALTAGSVCGSSALPMAMDALAESVEAGEFSPTLLLEDGKPKDFSFLSIGQYSGALSLETYPDFSKMLDAFYGRRDKAERMRQHSQTLTKTVKTLRDRLTRKLSEQKQELERTGEREIYRRRGDLITANLWRLGKGESSFVCEDYYEEDCPEVEIPLDPLKTPQQNAARCYKEYNKRKTAEKHLTEQIEKGEKELDYLCSVLDELSRAEGDKELSEIRRELIETGYVRPQKNAKREKASVSGPLRFCSSAGLEILVGRNNAQNDRLTLHDARRTDYWFHTQKIHGSHVVLCCEDREPDEQSLREAAMLAAWYSQGRENGKTPVDYTQIRFVRKLSGALPGKVIYTDYKTMIVEPEEQNILALQRK